ncbi:hypothetical protein [Kibdelosporangium philippinense]|uniref:hypothetical protein n=1 Tax=Kibdelosporangium philippinense TaxID=211113 RepID=UPI00360DD407
MDTASSKGRHDRKQRRTHCAGTVDTVCWNGGHGVLERWTRCAGAVDTVCWSGGHGVLERWTRCAGAVDTGLERALSGLVWTGRWDGPFGLLQWVGWRNFGVSLDRSG